MPDYVETPRRADRYFGPLVRSQRTAEIIADQRTDKNSGPVLAHGLPKLSFRNSAPLHLFGLFLKIFLREKNYQIMGVDTDTVEQRTAE
jgi:hypothetical protein